MDPVEIKLSAPILVDGRSVTVLRLRRPKARDLRVIKNMLDQMSGMLDLAAACADVPPSSIDQLELPDTNAVLEVIAGFMQPSPETGKTS